MKKFLIIVLTIALSFTFACDKDSDSKKDTFTSGDLTINIANTGDITAGNIIASIHNSNVNMGQNTTEKYLIKQMSTDSAASQTFTFERLTINPVYVNITVDADGNPIDPDGEYIFLYGASAQGDTAAAFTLQNGANTLNITYPNDFYIYTAE